MGLPIRSGQERPEAGRSLPTELEKKAWETAVALLFNATMRSESDAAGQEMRCLLISDLPSGDQRMVERVNSIIANVWERGNAAPGASFASPLEQAYTYAVQHMSERFPEPALIPASIPLIWQQELLLAQVPDVERKLPDHAVIVAETKDRLDAEAAEMLNGLLRADAAAMARTGFLELWLECIAADDVEVNRLREVLFAYAHEPDLGLQLAARLSSRRLIGSHGDPIDRGSLSQAVASVTQGDALERLDIPLARGETVEENRRRFAADWRQFTEQIRQNAPFKTRGGSLTPGQLARLYNLYLKRIEQAWHYFHDEQKQPWRVFQTLPLFLDVCETGWDTQTAQLLEGISQPIRPQWVPLRDARNERRECVQKRLSQTDLPLNVHYEKALRQILNEDWALGFSEEALGPDEPFANKQIVKFIAEELLNQGERHPDSLRQAAADALAKMNAEQRVEVLKFLTEGYREALRERQPYYLAPQDLQIIRDYQDEMLAALEEGRDLAPALGRPPVSAVTGRPLLSEEDQQQLSSFSGVLDRRKEDAVRKVKSIVQDAEVEEFARSIASSDSRGLSDYGVSLWLGVLGLVDFEDSSLLALALAMAPLKAQELKEKILERHWLKEVEKDGMQLMHAPAEIRANPKVVLQAVYGHSAALQFAAGALLNSPAFMRAAIQIHPSALAWAGECLRHDPVFLLEVLAWGGGALAWADDVLRHDRAFLLEAIRRNPEVLRHAADILRSDRLFVQQALQVNAMALQFAEEAFRNDRALVLDACRRDHRALWFAGRELCCDPEFVRESLALDKDWAVQQISDHWVSLAQNRALMLELLSQGPEYIHTVGLELRLDSEFMLEAMQLNHELLFYVDEGLRHDHAFNLELVRRDFNNLANVPIRVRRSPDFALKLVKINGLLLEDLVADLSEDLHSDRDIRDIVLEAVRNQGCALEFARFSRWSTDPEIVLEALRNDAAAFAFVEPGLKNDRAFILRAVDVNPWILEHLGPSYQQDPDVVLAAALQRGMVLQFAHPDLRRNPTILLPIVRRHGYALKYVDAATQSQHPEISRAAVQQDGLALEYVPDDLQQAHPDMVLEALKQNPMSLRYAERSAQKNEELVFFAVDRNWRAIEFADPSIQRRPDVQEFVARCRHQQGG